MPELPSYILRDKNAYQVLGYSSPVDAFAKELTRYGRYFAILKDIVRSENPGSEFEPVMSMAFTFTVCRHLHMGHFFIEMFEPGTKFAFNFDYRKVRADNITLMFPKYNFVRQRVEPLLEDKWLPILNAYHAIASCNHDFLEQMGFGNVISDYEKKLNVLPEENAVIYLHNRVMAEFLKDDVYRHKIIKTAVEGLMKLDELQQVNPELADYWLERIMSPLLFHIPIHDHAGEKVATSYGSLSLDDALRSYGISYELYGDDLDQLQADYSYWPPDPITAENVRQWRKYKIQSHPALHPFVLKAEKSFRKIAGLPDGDYEATTLHGFSAFCAQKLLGREDGYDFSHLWARTVDKVSVTRSKVSDELNSHVTYSIYWEVTQANGGWPTEDDLYPITLVKNAEFNAIMSYVKYLTKNELQEALVMINELYASVKKEEAARGVAPGDEVSFLPGIRRFADIMEAELNRPADLPTAPEDSPLLRLLDEILAQEGGISDSATAYTRC